MRSKLFYFFVEMIPADINEVVRYFGPFEDRDKAEFFALTKPNETLDHYCYVVLEMTNPVHF